jgi:hypothetical protein
MRTINNYKQFQQEISDCFFELAVKMNHHACTTYLYDFYLDKLYTDNGDINYEEWNDQTLAKMKSDIANVGSYVGDY